MTEREKMELGMWYDANNDEELLKQRVLAKDLCFDLDHIKPSSYEKRLEVITSLLGYQPINIELISPFMCDYGNKIKIGKNAFINSNCYFMDGGGINWDLYFLMDGDGSTSTGSSNDFKRTRILISSLCFRSQQKKNFIKTLDYK